MLSTEIDRCRTLQLSLINLNAAVSCELEWIDYFLYSDSISVILLLLDGLLGHHQFGDFS